MKAGLWFIVAAVSVAVALLAAGGFRLARETHALAVRASSVQLPVIDVDRARRSLQRLQHDADALTVLLLRLQAALLGIEDGVRAMARAFSRE